MNKREKLFKRLKNNSNNATFLDIQTLLKQEGFELDRVTGSHHVFIKGDITFVVPVHGSKVKAVYVRRVIELIEQSKD